MTEEQRKKEEKKKAEAARLERRLARAKRREELAPVRAALHKQQRSTPKHMHGPLNPLTSEQLTTMMEDHLLKERYLEANIVRELLRLRRVAARSAPALRVVRELARQAEPAIKKGVNRPHPYGLNALRTALDSVRATIAADPLHALLRAIGKERSVFRAARARRIASAARRKAAWEEVQLRLAADADPHGDMF